MVGTTKVRRTGDLATGDLTWATGDGFSRGKKSWNMVVSLLRTVSRRCALSATVCGGSAALAYATQASGAVAAAAASPPASDASLGAMWAAAIDGMLEVPGCAELSTPDGVLYMAPSRDAPKVEWPRIFQKSTVFALTGCNPMGVDAPAAANREANERLEQDIQELRPEPRAWWNSYGFNAEEGWREDGFCVAYANEERVYARMAVLKLARKYQQKAIYAYSYQDGQVVREVIFVGKRYGKTQEGSEETMAVLKTPPRTPLAARNWQQPS